MTQDPKLTDALATVRAAVRADRSGGGLKFTATAEDVDRVRIVDTSIDNTRGNTRLARRRPDGTMGIERRPSRACSVRPGGAIDPQTPLMDDEDWCQRVVDHHGHEFFQVMTSSSARVMTKKRFITDPSHMHALDKRLRFGWFPLNRCLVDTLDAEELTAKSLLVDLNGEEPCAPGSYSELNPCRHCVAERDARRAKNARVQAAIEKANTPVDRDKQLAEAASAAAVAALAPLLMKAKGK